METYHHPILSVISDDEALPSIAQRAGLPYLFKEFKAVRASRDGRCTVFCCGLKYSEAIASPYSQD